MAEDSNNEIDAIKKITLIQATFRGRLARLKIREAQQLYRDTVESIEGVTKADELQWVVHGCVPVPVHKLKEPEVAIFMRRLTERNLPDKTRRVVDMAGTSNSDSDTGTYVVSTSEKYSSIASVESSTLSSKTTSLVDGDFKSDEENTDETGSKTSDRSQQELDNKNFEKFCDSSDMNMENKMEEGSVGEELYSEPNKDLKTVDGKNTKMNGKSQTDNDDDSTKNLQMETESRKILSQGDDSLHQKDLEIGELSDGQCHRNSEEFRTEEEHDGPSRGSKEESEFNQMEIGQQRSDGKERVQSDLESSEMELAGENVHERCDRNREREAVDERLQEGVTDEDEDEENMEKQEQEGRLVSGGEENEAGLTQDVDNESKQTETSSKTTTMQVHEKLSTDCRGNEVEISSGEMTSLDRNGESSKEADGKSKDISEGREIEEKRKTESKNGSSSFIPPSPISHQRLPDNEQKLSSSSPILSHDATELSVLSQSNNGLKNGVSAVDGDSTMLTKVSSLASSSVWEDTSVWESGEESAMGTSRYPQDLTELQALRKNTAMELLWVQQAIESRKSYLRLKTNLEDKAKSQNLQT
ncbi:hypothetical protein BSL78_07981 [Apostichopus japonicus]|uniref:IQ domain-containing protein C n=1 Tax=Stichopus japonicus TaxID=307972 RepID=A0A2G8L4E5_STIJA|nr:hypothetical protein BSL78_07981 [Apostichopus japonicus]